MLYYLIRTPYDRDVLKYVSVNTNIDTALYLVQKYRDVCVRICNAYTFVANVCVQVLHGCRKAVLRNVRHCRVTAETPASS